MIIVTGGAGLIGSNIIKKLNFSGITEIILVDNLNNREKFHNLNELLITDYVDKDEFYRNIEIYNDIDVVFHLGACSDTTNWDCNYMLRNNFEYSKILYRWCQQKSVPLIYASSAAVYGSGKNGFNETPECEKPINIYAYSKLLFDQYVRHHSQTSTSQVVGLRYFNVYGLGEKHKGRMASTIFHFNNQISESGIAKLFKGTNEFSDGEQKRDFVYVEDCADINLWFYNNPKISGIYNVGTGKANTFNEIAKNIISWHKNGTISYIDFPTELMNSYQNFTQANISKLRKVGYSREFYSIGSGITDYLEKLKN